MHVANALLFQSRWSYNVASDVSNVSQYHFRRKWHQVKHTHPYTQTRTSRWYELHLHNDIVILSLFIITLVVIVRVVIHLAVAQATGSKMNRQGQKSAQMFPGNEMLLCVESSNSMQIAFKSCPLHNYSYGTRQKGSVKGQFLKGPYSETYEVFCPACAQSINGLCGLFKYDRICVQSCCITYPWDWRAADEKALQDSSLNRHEIISPSDWD